MDFSRRAYSVDCRFFKDSDITGRVAWYEVPETAPALPFESVILSKQQEPDDWLPGGVGEVAEAPRTTTLATAPPGLISDHICGTETEFREGEEYDPERPEVRYGSYGLPLCCFPPIRLRGGAGGFGGRVPYTVRANRLYGYAGPNGKTTYVIIGGFRLRRFAGASIRTDYALRPGFRLRRFAGGGGRCRLNDLSTYAQTSFGDFEFTAEETRPHYVELWGPGAGGQVNPFDSFPRGGGGGGGGAYARSVVNLVAGTTYAIRVGKGTDPVFDGLPAGSEASKFEDTVVRAAGGNTPGSNLAGDGGRVSESIGDVLFRGGNGAAGVDNATAGGGGGGAGAVVRGQDAIGNNGGLQIPFTTMGGDGQPSADPWDGQAPGGGGGGGVPGAILPHGKGADGAVLISWSASLGP